MNDSKTTLTEELAMEFTSCESKIRAAFANLRKDPVINREQELVIEWAQPALAEAKIAFGKDAGKIVLTQPREFASSVLKPIDVDVIRIHENGEIAWDRGDGNKEIRPNLKIGLDQVLSNQHVYHKHNKPYYSQQPVEIAYQFNTDTDQELPEEYVITQALSAIAGRNVANDEVTFEEVGTARFAHVDEAKIKIWFDTYFLAESTFAGVSDVFATDVAQEKLDTVCMSFAARLASDPFIDFIHLDREAQMRINHALTSFLGMLQVQYYQDDFKRTIETAIELGKRRKLAISHSPRVHPTFWDAATQVIIPKMGAWVGKEGKAVYSAFAPVVMAHPSYANYDRNKGRQSAPQRSKPIKPALPAYLLG
jgi:hypothetical protein